MRKTAPGPGPWALGDVLDAAADTLARAGLPDARREVVMLWSAIAGRPAGDAWLRRDVTLSADDYNALAVVVARRAGGVPAAYATGWAAFRALDLAVDGRVLIPRPETEGLVDLVLARVDKGAAVVDVGTGSGCIALSLAAEGAGVTIVATDVSADALAVARANAERIAPPVAVDFREGPYFAPLAPDERFDIIVSNPPYLTEEEYARLDPSVRAHEPRLALVSGEDGLDHVRLLLAGADRWLVSGGLVALEVDSNRADAVLAIARNNEWSGARIHTDLFGRPRYLLAAKP